MGRARPATKSPDATASGAAFASLAHYCPDLGEWPQRWHAEVRDLAPGQQIVAALEPFLLHLLTTGLSRKTLRMHRDNLWLLGGEIIRRLHDEPALRRCSATTLLNRFVEPDGGPLIYPSISETQQNSFDTTCRKFHAFLFNATDAKERIS